MAEQPNTQKGGQKVNNTDSNEEGGTNLDARNPKVAVRRGPPPYSDYSENVVSKAMVKVQNLKTLRHHFHTRLHGLKKTKKFKF